jgi:hypothetical protein
MNLDPLLQCHEPWLHLLVAGESDACNALWALQKSSHSHAQCRVARGHKATTEAALFDECAAAWQFPYYFGENWDAFEECITDLEWLPAKAYVFFVNRAIHLLEKEPKERFDLLLSVLQNSAKEWGQPTYGHPAKFHVLLQGTATEQPSLERRLQGAGVSYDIIQ